MSDKNDFRDVTPQMREEYLVASTNVKHGRTNLMAAWCQLGAACCEIIDKKLYYVENFNNWRDYFEQVHNMSRSHVEILRAMFREFGHSPISKLPYGVAVEIFSSSDEARAKIRQALKKIGTATEMDVKKAVNKVREHLQTTLAAQAPTVDRTKTSTAVAQKSTSKEAAKTLSSNDKEQMISTSQENRLKTQIGQVDHDLDILIAYLKKMGPVHFQTVLAEYQVIEKMSSIFTALYTPEQHAKAAVFHLDDLCTHLEEKAKRDHAAGSFQPAYFKQFNTYFEQVNQFHDQFRALTSHEKAKIFYMPGARVKSAS